MSQKLVTFWTASLVFFRFFLAFFVHPLYTKE